VKCSIEDGGMVSGISSIKTSFLHGSYRSRHIFTLIFFCLCTEVLLSLQSLGSSMLRPGSVQSCQFNTLTFLHGDVVIKYVTTTQLGKRVVVRGMGTVSRDGYFLKVLALLCDWSMFSSVDTSLAAGKMRKN
jgi:hypothetical protein